jgi:hypothetical protein
MAAFSASGAVDRSTGDWAGPARFARRLGTGSDFRAGDDCALSSVGASVTGRGVSDSLNFKALISFPIKIQITCISVCIDRRLSDHPFAARAVDRYP